MFRTGFLSIIRSLVLYTQQYEVDVPIAVYTVLYISVYTVIGIIITVYILPSITVE